MANEPVPETPTTDTQAVPAADGASIAETPAATASDPSVTTPEAEGDKDEAIKGPESVIEKVEHLTEDDIRAAIRWIMGSLPAPFVQSFYDHHPKFKP